MNNQTMKPYADTDRDSGVEAYSCSPDSIVVKFREGTYQHYEYTHASAGSTNVEQMKLLAESGDGLNAFINIQVRFRYSKKW